MHGFGIAGFVYPRPPAGSWWPCEEDHAAFERYLATHPAWQAEVDELGAFANLLAFSPQQQKPSPELRRKVMEVVEAEAAPRRDRRRSMLAAIKEYPARRTIALGAAAVLVIGLLSWNVLLQAQTEPPERQVQRRAG